MSSSNNRFGRRTGGQKDDLRAEPVLSFNPKRPATRKAQNEAGPSLGAGPRSIAHRRRQRRASIARMRRNSACISDTMRSAIPFRLSCAARRLDRASTARMRRNSASSAMTRISILGTRRVRKRWSRAFPLPSVRFIILSSTRKNSAVAASAGSPPSAQSRWSRSALLMSGTISWRGRRREICSTRRASRRAAATPAIRRRRNRRPIPTTHRITPRIWVGALAACLDAAGRDESATDARRCRGAAAEGRPV